MCCWMKNEALDCSLPMKKKTPPISIFTCFCPFALCRGNKPSRGGGADVPADTDDDPASSGHEALPAVPNGDGPPSSAQHEPLPQLQHGECDTKKEQQPPHTHTGTLASGNKTKTCDALMFLYFLNCLRKPDIPHCTLSA